MSKIVNCGQTRKGDEKEFIDYWVPLLLLLKQKQVKENIILLFQRVMREKTMQIWGLSDNKREYDNFHNLVNGTLKNRVDVEKLNCTLLLYQIEKISGKYSLSLIYDGSDIRKSESEQLENLGWVKPLSGGWIRGFG